MILLVGKVTGHYTMSCGLCVVVKFETTEGEALHQSFQNYNCEEHKSS